nr:MAG TPA: hypothetical protein [Caudoviricetes sp.]
MIKLFIDSTFSIRYRVLLFKILVFLFVLALYSM